MTKSNNKTTVEHWDENWQRASSSAIRGNRATQSATFVWQRMKRSFDRALACLDPSRASLIEVGAGGSEWLPLLRKTYGFQVTGLDYSEVGCVRARAIMEDDGLDGQILQGDMFFPPMELIGAFDAVVSFGLVEHFEDTSGAISACARFARPGGVVITTIPNMAGLYGHAFKLYDRRTYDAHVPLTPAQLANAHRTAGLDVLFSECLFGLPGVMDGDRLETSSFKRVFRSAAHRLTKLHWSLEARGFGFPENRFTSPYLMCVAKVSTS